MPPTTLCRVIRRGLTIACALVVAGGSGSLAAEHTLMPTPQTVHIGHFLASLRPVLTIDSGDIVTLQSAVSIMPSAVDASGVVPPSAVPQYQRDIYATVRDRGPGPHILTGPIEVRGAMPGDVLEVRILEIDLILDWGFNYQRPYAGSLPDEFTGFWSRIIPINRQAKTAEVATFFLERGVKPDVRSRDGLTPLMAQAASLEVAEVLLRAGARPNLREAEGRTALHMVVGSGSGNAIDGAAVLCAYGADPMVADEKGETARAAAARMATAPNASDGTLAMSRFLAAGGVCDRLREKTGGRGGIDKDVVAAAAHEARCEAGDAWACGRIGLAYEKGKGVAKDLSRSARLYERSCERGHAWGCYALGYSFAEGEGVGQHAVVHRRDRMGDAGRIE
jgi:hypothetical protein